MTKHELLTELWAMEQAEPTEYVHSPKDILPLLQKYANRKQEEFVVITLDNSNNVIKTRTVTKGLVNMTQVHPREVFRPAILDNATSVILAHNHPSGSVQPSESDRKVMEQLNSVSKLIDITILDHLIISKAGYYSYKEMG